MILVLIFSFIIIYILTIIYYNFIKKIKMVGKIKCINCSLLSLWLLFIKKITKGKQSYICIINPFTKTLHFCHNDYYNTIQEHFNVYKHEMKHFEQIEKNGVLKFCIKYLYYLIRYGYKNNPFEKEAYNAEENGN